MAQESHIIIDDVDVDQNTGHITLWVYMHTKDGNAEWNGPRRGYGCDATMFHGMFGGDIEQLKNWVHSQHCHLHGAHLEFVDQLMKMKGERMPVQNLDPENKNA